MPAFVNSDRPDAADLLFPIAVPVTARPLAHPISASTGHWGALERRRSASSDPANQIQMRDFTVSGLL